MSTYDGPYRNYDSNVEEMTDGIISKAIELEYSNDSIELEKNSLLLETSFLLEKSLSILIRNFVSLKSLCFHQFRLLWVQSGISLIYSSIRNRNDNVNNSIHYIFRHIINILKESNTFINNSSHRSTTSEIYPNHSSSISIESNKLDMVYLYVGTIYTLYTLYFTQPTENLSPIQINSAEFITLVTIVESIKRFHSFAVSSNHNNSDATSSTSVQSDFTRGSVSYCFQRLIKENAFLHMHSAFETWICATGVKNNDRKTSSQILANAESVTLLHSDLTTSAPVSSSSSSSATTDIGSINDNITKYVYSCLEAESDYILSNLVEVQWSNLNNLNHSDTNILNIQKRPAVNRVKIVTEQEWRQVLLYCVQISEINSCDRISSIPSSVSLAQSSDISPSSYNPDPSPNSSLHHQILTNASTHRINTYTSNELIKYGIQSIQKVNDKSSGNLIRMSDYIRCLENLDPKTSSNPTPGQVNPLTQLSTLLSMRQSKVKRRFDVSTLSSQRNNSHEMHASITVEKETISKNKSKFESQVEKLRNTFTTATTAVKSRKVLGRPKGTSSSRQPQRHTDGISLSALRTVDSAHMHTQKPKESVRPPVRNHKPKKEGMKSDEKSSSFINKPTKEVKSTDRLTEGFVEGLIEESTDGVTDFLEQFFPQAQSLDDANTTPTATTAVTVNNEYTIGTSSGGVMQSKIRPSKATSSVSRTKGQVTSFTSMDSILSKLPLSPTKQPSSKRSRATKQVLTSHKSAVSSHKASTDIPAPVVTSMHTGMSLLLLLEEQLKDLEENETHSTTLLPATASIEYHNMNTPRGTSGQGKRKLSKSTATDGSINTSSGQERQHKKSSSVSSTRSFAGMNTLLLLEKQLQEYDLLEHTSTFEDGDELRTFVSSTVSKSRVNNARSRSRRKEQSTECTSSFGIQPDQSISKIVGTDVDSSDTMAKNGVDERTDVLLNNPRQMLRNLEEITNSILNGRF